jgi:hypothetical protein
MSDYQDDTDDSLDEFVARVDAALTAQFGPDHQRILSQGRTVSEFDWGCPVGSEAW